MVVTNIVLTKAFNQYNCIDFLRLDSFKLAKLAVFRKLKAIIQLTLLPPKEIVLKNIFYLILQVILACKIFVLKNNR